MGAKLSARSNDDADAYRALPSSSAAICQVPSVILLPIEELKVGDVVDIKCLPSGTDNVDAKFKCRVVSILKERQRVKLQTIDTSARRLIRLRSMMRDQSEDVIKAVEKLLFFTLPDDLNNLYDHLYIAIISKAFGERYDVDTTSETVPTPPPMTVRLGRNTDCKFTGKEVLSLMAFSKHQEHPLETLDIYYRQCLSISDRVISMFKGDEVTRGVEDVASDKWYIDGLTQPLYLVEYDREVAKADILSIHLLLRMN
jgi:hypothetical protein